MSEQVDRLRAEIAELEKDIREIELRAFEGADGVPLEPMLPALRRALEQRERDLAALEQRSG